MENPAILLTQLRRQGRKAVIFALAALLTSVTAPPNVSAGTIMLTWSPQTDNGYNDKLNWIGCNCFPNNTANKTYAVSILSGSGDLDVNISPTIDSFTNVDSNVDILSGKTLTLGALSNGGALTIDNNASLVIASGSGALVTNNGTIDLGASGKATSLTFDSGGPAATFTLTGSGTVALSNNANNLIAGNTGHESLINDVNQTIQGSGTIGNLASFQNNGTLTSNGSKPLIVSAPLGNWDSANLNGGTYNVYANIQLGSIGSAGINALQRNANVTINGPGILTGDGSTNALSTLNNITDSSLTFTTNGQISPQGGTLTLSTSGTDGLAEASLNVSGATLKVTGSLANNDLGNSSTVTLNGGSALKVSGSYTQSTSTGAPFLAQASTLIDQSTLTIGGTFTQDLGSALTISTGGTVKAKGLNNLGTISLLDAASVADFRTGIAGNSFANLSNGTLTGGTYNLTGTLYYDPSAPGNAGGRITALDNANVTLNAGGQMVFGNNGKEAFTDLTLIADSTLSLNSSTVLPTITPKGGTLTVAGLNTGAQLLLDGTNLTISGNLANFSSFAVSGIPVTANVTVQNGSTLTVTGAYAQSPGASTNVSGSTLYANGFSNGYFSDFSGSGSISVDATGTADFRTGTPGDSFANLTNGTLKGGSYDVAGTLYYDASTSGGAITTLKGANVGLEGGGQMLYGGQQGSASGTQAFLTLANIKDSTFTLTNATALPNITPDGGTLAVSNSELTLNATTLSVTGNLSNRGVSSSVAIQNGSDLGISGSFTQSGFANTTVDASAFTVGGTLKQTQDSILTLQNGARISAQGFTNNDSSLFVLDTSVADFTGGGGAFTNLSKNGTLGGGGSYTVEGTLSFNGGNVVHLASGTFLDLIGTGSLLTGARTNALADLKSNAGTLQLDSNSNGGASLTTSGNFHNKGGLVTINSESSMTVNGNFRNVNGGIVALNGPGSSLTVTGFFNNTAGSLLQVGNTFDRDPLFTSHGFANNGTLVVGQGSTATVVRLASLTTADGVTTLGGGTYAINGTFEYNGLSINVIGAGTDVSLDARGTGIQAAILDGGGTDALGSLDEIVGSLALSGGQAETVGEGAIDFMVDSTGSLFIGAGFTGQFNGLGGSGLLTIDAPGLVSDGTVIVGSFLGSGSTLTLVDGGVDSDGGSYTQAGTASLILDIDDNFTNVEYSDPAGIVNLAGTLEVNPEAGFTAALGDEFTIFAFGSLTGNFTTFDFGTFGDNLTFKEIVDPNDIKLEVINGTPEPSTWLLFAAGLLAVSILEYRRRNSDGLRIQ